MALYSLRAASRGPAPHQGGRDRGSDRRGWVACGAALLAIVLLTSSGCGSGDGPPTVYPASGKVLLKGKPLAKARVRLYPVAGGEASKYPSHGETQDDGTFRLTTWQTHDGAPAGDFTVTVEWPKYTTLPSGDVEEGPDRLGGRYTLRNGQPAATVTIKPGDNILPTIDLK